VVVRGEQSAPLRATLTAVASGRVDGPTFVATPADLDIERTLGSRLRGELPRGLVARLLPRLADCADVHFDGQPITVSADPVVPHGRLVEEDGGFRLSVGRDPSVTELIEPGLALCGGTGRVSAHGPRAG
jgi:hypothetical protein